MIRASLLAGVLLATVLAVACGPGGTAGGSPMKEDTPGSGTPAGGRLIASLNPDVHYPESFDEETGLRSILGTPDLGVGRQRVSFLLAHESGLVRFPAIRAASYRYPEGPDGPRIGPVESNSAQFFNFPLGTRGIYVTELDFDRAGTWGLEVSFPDADGGRTSTALTFEVRERTSAPAVGEPAPASVNSTLADVESIKQLTTGSDPDPGLYRSRIADAIAAGRPFALVFASPAFCTNAFCGPQVQVLTALRERYSGRADFIHVDLFANPHEIKGDLARAVRNPLLAEWGITSDEWTFVVDREGRISGRFESFAPEEELEQALLRVVGETGAS